MNGSGGKETLLSRVGRFIFSSSMFSMLFANVTMMKRQRNTERSLLACWLWCLSVSLFLKSHHAWTSTTILSSRRIETSTLSALHVSGLSTSRPNSDETQDEDDDRSRRRIMRQTTTQTTTTDDAISSFQQEQQEQQQQDESSGIAIILNTNARGVTSDLVHAIQTQFVVSDSNNNNRNKNVRVFVTSTKEQALEAVQELQLLPAKIVIPIGGDGTLTTMIQSFHDSKEKLPLFGYIPMGTGNALGTVIGCKPKYRFRKANKMKAMQQVLQQLLDIAQEQETISADIVDLPLLQITTTTTTHSNNNKNNNNDMEQQHEQKACCFFAGIGFDSLMLQDYKDLQEWSSQSSFWKHKFRSVWGYTVALVTRTLPKCIQHQSHIINVELSTNSTTTLWVDHRRGDVVRRIPHDNHKKDPLLLYKGQAGIVAASTTPFYGGNLKLFPFARLTEHGCQLRIGRIHPLEGVWNIPKIFQGTYRNSDMGCLDFIGTQFSLNILERSSYPVQHSGESMGNSQQVEFQVMKDPVQFVTLLPPRLVYEQEEDEESF